MVDALSVLTDFVPQSEVINLDLMRTEIRRWLETFRPMLPSPADPGSNLDTRLTAVRELQKRLFEAGWARMGWPENLGGLGGDARHRAVLYDELASAGYSSRYALEHLEILAPALAVHWDPAQFGEVLPALMSGEELWCQGFSEPDAGSDLVALRTTAIKDGDDYVLQGRKVWTSWAPQADRCVVLARTGDPAERHRGLSVFFVDVASDGVEVRPLRLASGLDELAEVTFDEVRVPAGRLVGGEGRGWQVTLDVLSCERSAFAWLRHAHLLSRADELARRSSEATAHELGNVLTDLFSVRLAAASAIGELAEGRFMGPAAAPVKVLLTDAEQHLYDLALRIDGPELALGSTRADVSEWQEEYLFSRAVSIYGGTRQMQLSTIARFLLQLPDGRSTK